MHICGAIQLEYNGRHAPPPPPPPPKRILCEDVGATTQQTRNEKMGERKRLIPFSWLPAAWGLKGRTRAIAQAEYELEGEALEYKLADINAEEIGDIKHQIHILSLDKKYNRIEEEAFEYKLAELKEDDHESERYQKTLLELDKQFDKITEAEYNKRLATLNGEPYINVISMEINEEAQGAFEFDWNDKFIEILEEAGYVAPSQEQVVDLWFSKVCKSVALEMFDGLGTTTEDLEKADQSRIQRDDKGNGKWEAS